jgi:hypothetical protein
MQWQVWGLAVVDEEGLIYLPVQPNPLNLLFNLLDACSV